MNRSATRRNRLVKPTAQTAMMPTPVRLPDLPCNAW